MASHKYSVGQNVSFRPTRMSTLSGRQDCKIIRLLPVEDGNCLYRIKCVDESVERVVQEGLLAVRPLRE